MATASQRGASPIRLSNHSYGERRGWENLENGPQGSGWYWYGDIDVDRKEDFRFGFYSQKSEDWDQTVHNNEYLLPVVAAGNERNEGPSDSDQPVDHYFFDDGSWVLAQFESRPKDCSQDNAGYDCLDGISVTKNPLVVGVLKDDGVTPTDFTAFGPTDDGRIKPDLMANGETVKSPVSGSNTAYDVFDGTSMAAPAVTGSIALLKELLGSAKYRTSTLKAILLHTADNFIGPKSGPDYKTGWGRMNTERAAEVIKTEVNATDTVHVVDQVTLDDGTTREFEVTTTESLESLRATIAWTDPPGDSPFDQVDPTDKMLVNDLDLRVIRKSNGAEHRPYKLDPSNPGSQTVLRGDNERDNVEQVFISDPASGATYTVRVSHDGSLNGFSQDFGLVVTGNTSLTLTGGGGDQDPLSVDLSGPSKLNSGENGTWTASVTGGSGSTSYDWEYQSPGSNTWKSASCSGTDCTRSFSNNDDQAKTGRIRVTVTKGNETDTAAQPVEVVLPDLNVTLSGPFSIDSGQQYTWYALVDGGVGSASYSWEVNPTFASGWASVYCSGSSCTTSFYNTCDRTRSGGIRVTVSKTTRSETASKTVSVSPDRSIPYSTAGEVTPNAPPCSFTKTASTAKAAGGIRLSGSSLQVEGQIEDAVHLPWRTDRARIPDCFVVQHRADTTGTWSSLGTVPAGDSARVDSANTVAYRFRAEDVDVGTHQFRLVYERAGPGKQSMRASRVVTATVEMNEAYRLRAYPNPVRERATVELAVKEAQEVTVAVYDLLGRRVTTLMGGRLPAQETRQLSLDASRDGLSSGTYFVRMQGKGFVATERLTVVQ